MRIVFILFFSFILLFATTCKNKVGSEDNAVVDAVAKAGEVELSSEELKASIGSNELGKDSSLLRLKIIDHWAQESLFYQEAVSKLYEEEMLIDKQVEAYKRELVNYIYQTKIIEANLDTTIEMEEITQYYNLHRDNFILKENIVKVNYIKVPLKAPPIEKIKRFVLSVNPADVAQLKILCSQHAENYFLNDSTWLFMDEIRREIPALKDQPDVSLYAGRVVQYVDDNYFYFLKIKDVKVKNALSPLNFEKQNIKKFIINGRKTALINQYKQLLLEKAKSEKKFVVY